MKRRNRLSRLTFRLLEATFGLAFLGTVVHHVVTQDMRPLLALCLPILIVYYGLASLLFVRGRSLTPGPWQIRSLHAAEHAMRATIWHLFGIMLGMSVYGLLRYLRVPFDPAQPALAALWLMMFSAPYVLMQIGLLCIMRAIWVLSPDFAGPMSAFETRRRIQERVRRLAYNGRA